MERYLFKLEFCDDHVTANCDAFDLTVDADTADNAVEQLRRLVQKTGAELIKQKQEFPQSDQIDQNVGVVLVEVDINRYYRETSTEVVRRTVSLPMYLDEQIRNSGLDSSKIFRDAIQKELQNSEQITSLEELEARVNPELLRKAAAKYLLQETEGNK